MEEQKKNAKKINDDNRVNKDENKSTNINKNNNTNEDTNKNQDKVLKEKHEQNNVFILEKKSKESDELKRQTYYLNDQLIELIDNYSQQSGYNKSELVRMALEHFFNNLEIQE